MPANLRLNDIQTALVATLFDVDEHLLLTATQPVPTNEQEATVIIVNLVNVRAD